MKVMELQGVARGKKVITTNPDATQPCPDDKVSRASVAQMPNQLCELMPLGERNLVARDRARPRESRAA